MPQDTHRLLETLALTHSGQSLDCVIISVMMETGQSQDRPNLPLRRMLPPLLIKWRVLEPCDCEE
jgi:hypothetical protein